MSLFKITEDTATNLNNNNLKTVGQLFITNPNHTIDTTRPKNMLQLINKRDNIPLRNLITIHTIHTVSDNTLSKQRSKHSERWNTCLALGKKFNKEEKRKEIERFQHTFPLALSDKTRNLTDEIITKEEYSRGYKNIIKAQTSTYNQSLALEI